MPQVLTRTLAALAMFCALPYAVVRAQDVATAEIADADRVAIHDVVEAQLQALRNDDGVLAFSYASPMLQEQFGTAENFLAMVKSRYAAVYRPRDVQFREIEASYDGPIQKVFFFGPDGAPVLGLYLMQQAADGSWKINGCALTEPPDIGI